MRFKLLRRRLTISAPRMKVRSAMPWPLRWAVVAIVLGFCGAIGLWAFELGKGIAGLDTGAKEELVRLRGEVAKLREERDQAQSILNTSGSLITAEKAAQGRLAAQIKSLEAENRALRDDLGFFEKLIPAGGAEGVAIRGLQAEVLAAGNQLKWQVLVIQPVKNAPEFRGKLARIDAAANATTRQVELIAEFNDRAKAPQVSGLYAEGRVESADRRALVLAEGSVVRQGDNAFVWKVAGNQLKKMPVTLGERDDRRGEVVIASGLAMGDEVLRAPTSSLTDGAPVQRVAAGAGAAAAVASAKPASK